MKEYSCAELGMLIGAALGGVLAVTGFSVFNSAWFFLLAGIGVAAGVIIGRKMDMRQAKSDNSGVYIDGSSDREEI